MKKKKGSKPKKVLTKLRKTTKSVKETKEKHVQTLKQIYEVEDWRGRDERSNKNVDGISVIAEHVKRSVLAALTRIGTTFPLMHTATVPRLTTNCTLYWGSFSHYLLTTD
jgi:hypothetical protein